jgi:hypothetical protein
LKILQIVSKNTSVTDFTAPIFWGLKKRQIKSDILIIYCVGDKRRILRQSKFLSNLFFDCGIHQFDYLDIIDFKSLFFENVLRFVSKTNYSIQLHYKIKATSRWTDFPCLFRSFAGRALRRLSTLLDIWLAKKIDFERFLIEWEPDVIMLDNRENSDFPGAKQFLDQIFRLPKPKLVIPHAPHFVDPFYAFSRIHPFGKEFYPECEVWLPFKRSEPDRKYPSLKHHFKYIGYPGLDEEWINFCKPNRIRKVESVRCLYVGRKFLNKNIKRPEGYDFVTMDYASVLADLLVIKNAFKKLNIKMDFIFKPHPSSSYKLVEEVLKQASFDSWSITNEPIYSEMKSCDVVVSSYSTAVLVTAVAGIQTVLFNSEIQREVNNSWKALESLYGGLSYVIDAENLEDVLNSGLNSREGVNKDRRHVRNFFPDGAIDRSIDRLLALTHNC